MKIELREIAIRDIVEGYVDNDENGVVGFGGKLNIRPKYQREFVYKDKQRVAVIDTIKKGFPLNVMYWTDCEDGTFEILDGQQRTVSFCQYIEGVFSVDKKYFFNLTQAEKNAILDYKCMVYVCTGSDYEKLEWFKTINIAGEKLTNQELRNAVYAGSWLTHAKSIFSKTNCAAYNLAKQYVAGEAIRQEVLETALKWISNGNIEEYMAKHQHCENADELWKYFLAVIEWAKKTFPVERKQLKTVDWGMLYDRYKDETFDADALEMRVKELLKDDDVSNKSGVYPYVLTNDERYLNIRAFTQNQKTQAYERQHGVCALCNKYFEIGQMDADHIVPWSKGGKTVDENCQVLCKKCNLKKLAK